MEVSVVTPTYNRRKFIPTLIELYKNQTYPKEKMEWIIVDDGRDKVEDLFQAAAKDIPNLRYIYVDEKMRIGAKRNLLNKEARGAIIVAMDDDDYYPPERISHAVETLQANPRALCAGSSEIYLYFKQIRKMYQFGPYNPNHATAATFAFRRELLTISRYDDKACLAEEKHFLKDYTIPFVQLDPLKTILVFSHEHNSFDKRKLLENPHPQFVKESAKTVDMFIRTAGEQKIKKFFMEDIDQLLSKYAPGEPVMKQDVLKQMREIDAERQKMAAQMQQQQQQQILQPGQPIPPGMQPQIMMQEPGKAPVAIGIVDAVNIINQQQQHIKMLEDRIKDLEAKVAARPVSPPKTVGFSDSSESIMLAKGKSAMSEVAKLREKIQELENQLKTQTKKSKDSFADAIRSDSEPPKLDIAKTADSKTNPEVKLEAIPEDKPTQGSYIKSNPVSKTEPEVMIGKVSQPPTTTPPTPPTPIPTSTPKPIPVDKPPICTSTPPEYTPKYTMPDVLTSIPEPKPTHKSTPSSTPAPKPTIIKERSKLEPEVQIHVSPKPAISSPTPATFTPPSIASRPIIEKSNSASCASHIQPNSPILQTPSSFAVPSKLEPEFKISVRAT